MLRTIITAALLVALATVAAAADYDKGLAAYRDGDFREAIAQWRPLAEQDDPRAQYWMGRMYFYGFGVVQDRRVALELYLKAANQGYARAQYSVGVSYTTGLGAAEDLEEGFRWYLKAARNGHSRAQYILGRYYRSGRGPVQRDCSEAIQWFARAAAGGSLSAQFAVAHLYETGECGRQDYHYARELYLVLAMQGHGGSMISLAGLYIEGKGGEPDPVEAWAWLNLAAALGWDDAVDLRQELSTYMTREEINRAQARSREIEDRIVAEAR